MSSIVFGDGLAEYRSAGVEAKYNFLRCFLPA